MNLQPEHTSFRVAKVNPSAVVPRKATAGSAGFDLISVESAIVLPGARKLLSTGLVVSLPEGTYGRIVPCAGLELRAGICVGAGIIDADHAGVLNVLLFNLDLSEPFEVNVGDRIAQLVLERYESGGSQEAELVPIEAIKGASSIPVGQYVRRVV